MLESALVLPDVSQRVMTALSAVGECPEQSGCLPLQEGETPALIVPPHLRNLNLLLCTLGDEAEAAMAYALAKYEAFRVAGNLYHESVRTHIPGFEEDWGGKVPVLREGWNIVLAEPNAPLCRPEAQSDVSEIIFSVPKFGEEFFERPV
jgi:hypothetical protein